MSTWNPGAWIDVSLPDLGDVCARASIDPTAFSAWLAPQVGTFRDEMRIKREFPTRADELKFLRDLRGRLGELSRLLQGVPPRARAVLSSEAHKVEFQTEMEWQALVDRITRDMALAASLVAHVEGMFPATRSKLGRKLTITRDMLFAVVATRIRDMQPAEYRKVEAARGFAAEILTLCGVEAPTPGVRKRAARRGKK
ncbi:MAG: hypothetical protein ACR2HE_10880 [Casimicrobiaceae bacterium]